MEVLFKLGLESMGKVRMCGQVGGILHGAEAWRWGSWMSVGGAVVKLLEMG